MFLVIHTPLFFLSHTFLCCSFTSTIHTGNRQYVAAQQQPADEEELVILLQKTICEGIIFFKKETAEQLHSQHLHRQHRLILSIHSHLPNLIFKRVASCLYRFEFRSTLINILDCSYKLKIVVLPGAKATWCPLLHSDNIPLRWI